MDVLNVAKLRMFKSILVIESFLAIFFRANETIFSKLVFQNTTYLPKLFLLGAVGTLRALLLPGIDALFAQQNSTARVSTLIRFPQCEPANQTNKLWPNFLRLAQL